MEIKQNDVNCNETSNPSQQRNTDSENYRSVMYISRNKFLKKYHFPATIFDKYIETGRLPFHRTGKTVEVEEYRTLETLRRIELENAEAVRVQSIKNQVAKPVPIVVTDIKGLKIRRKKLDA